MNEVKEFFKKLRSIKMPNGQWYRIEIYENGVMTYRGEMGDAKATYYMNNMELQFRWKVENGNLYWKQYTNKLGFYISEDWYKAEFKLRP